MLGLTGTSKAMPLSRSSDACWRDVQVLDLSALTPPYSRQVTCTPTCESSSVKKATCALCFRRHKKTFFFFKAGGNFKKTILRVRSYTSWHLMHIHIHTHHSRDTLQAGGRNLGDVNRRGREKCVRHERIANSGWWTLVIESSTTAF